MRKRPLTSAKLLEVAEGRWQSAMAQNTEHSWRRAGAELHALCLCAIRTRDEDAETLLSWASEAAEAMAWAAWRREKGTPAQGAGTEARI